MVQNVHKEEKKIDETAGKDDKREEKFWSRNFAELMWTLRKENWNLSGRRRQEKMSRTHLVYGMKKYICSMDVILSWKWQQNSRNVKSNERHSFWQQREKGRGIVVNKNENWIKNEARNITWMKPIPAKRFVFYFCSLFYRETLLDQIC